VEDEEKAKIILQGERVIDMKTVRAIFKAILFTIEKVIAELAILAAILSIAHEGSYIERILGGMATIFQAIYGFIHAYAINIGFRDFMGNFTASILDALASIATNIQSDPRRVLVAFIATYISYKVIAILLRIIRKKALRCKKSGNKPAGSDDVRGGRTYNQLYNDGGSNSPTTPTTDQQ
jgi:hypothetical protein